MLSCVFGIFDTMRSAAINAMSALESACGGALVVQVFSQSDQVPRIARGKDLRGTELANCWFRIEQFLPILPEWSFIRPLPRSRDKAPPRESQEQGDRWYTRSGLRAAPATPRVLRQAALRNAGAAPDRLRAVEIGPGAPECDQRIPPALLVRQ